MYWHTNRLQFPLSRMSRCNICYRAVLQLDMKNCWFCSFFVRRCVLSINWITYASCIVLAFSVLAFSSTCVFSAPNITYNYLCSPNLIMYYNLLQNWQKPSIAEMYRNINFSSCLLLRYSSAGQQQSSSELTYSQFILDSLCPALPCLSLSCLS